VSAANPAQALALVLVDELARHGVTDAVIAPGSRSAPLAMALHEEPRFRLHVQIDERSAAFTALGLARVSRRPTVVACTSGTAAANFLPAVVEAHQARVPLLVLTADRPPELRHTAANQTIDQIKLYGDVVRWFAEVGVPEDDAGSVRYWRSLASRAVAETAGSPAGPVHLNLAFREPLVPEGAGFTHDLDGRPGGRPWTVRDGGRGAPTPEQVERLTVLVRTHRRGVVVVGESDSAPGPVLDLAQAAGWPVLAEPFSGARQGPHAISTAGLLLGDPGFAAAHRADAVVRLGRVHLSRHLGAYLAAAGEQVLVDPDGAWLDPERAADRIVAADAGLLCAAVAAQVGTREPGAWLQAWQVAEQRARSAVDALLDAEEAPSEPRTARDLSACLVDGGLLVAASSMPVRDLDLFAAPRPGLRVLGNRGASGIDGFVSTALGAALAHPGPVTALSGDLSLLHDQNGLLLADRPDLVLVLVNNDGGGIFSFLPQARFPGSFEAVFATPHGVDFGQLAGVYGVGHRAPERAADLPGAVRAARQAGGVQLVEVRTDRAANVALHDRLRRAAVAAIR
jgi:2-succinyl-5-enolpyruvyl-6-hydroxy-3-cyclohexene-1-carboxylate synthase